MRLSNEIKHRDVDAASTTPQAPPFEPPVQASEHAPRSQRRRHWLSNAVTGAEKKTAALAERTVSWINRRFGYQISVPSAGRVVRHGDALDASSTLKLTVGTSVASLAALVLPSATYPLMLLGGLNIPVVAALVPAWLSNVGTLGAIAGVVASSTGAHAANIVYQVVQGRCARARDDAAMAKAAGEHIRLSIWAALIHLIPVVSNVGSAVALAASSKARSESFATLDAAVAGAQAALGHATDPTARKPKR